MKNVLLDKGIILPSGEISKDSSLLNSMIIADNLHSAIFSLAAYTVILCFSLFKSGALAKSIFNAH